VLYLVLLSLVEPGWKIADFGLTEEGASRIAYTTLHSRGTECYRAPELVRERSAVSMKSDIFALGCILFELVMARKAFPRDIHVFEYASNREIPAIVMPETVDDRVASYLTQLIHGMLQVDWWQRPPTRDILKLLSRLADGRDEIWSKSENGRYTRIHEPSQRSRLWKRLILLPQWSVLIHHSVGPALTSLVSNAPP